MSKSSRRYSAGSTWPPSKRMQEAVRARDALEGLRLVERQPVGVDARLVRPGHQLEIEAGPAPRPAIDDDLDHREAQKAGRGRDVEMTRPAVADLEHGRARPDDLLDQNDRIVPRAGAARRKQPCPAGAIAEAHAAHRQRLGGRGAGRDAKERNGNQAPEEEPDRSADGRPRSIHRTEPIRCGCRGSSERDWYMSLPT